MLNDNQLVFPHMNDLPKQKKSFKKGALIIKYCPKIDKYLGSGNILSSSYINKHGDSHDGFLCIDHIEIAYTPNSVNANDTFLIL